MNIKLSVCVITYNHGEYLHDCIVSIINQKTNFRFEIVIGDDASDDGVSRTILASYAKRYKDLISVIFRDKNIGPQQNYFDTVGRCGGEYICYIDGDDAMCPGKLQAQVDILDAYPDCAVVFHDLCRIDQVPDKPCNIHIKIFDPLDWLKRGCFLAHSSKMYRRNSIITRASDRVVIDLYLHIEHSRNGKIFYLDHCYGKKRIHSKMITKNQEFYAMLFRGHLNAYDRAIELGYDKGIALSGKIRVRQRLGVSLILKDKYSEGIEYLSVDKNSWPYSSFHQRLLCRLSGFPRLIKIIGQIRQCCRLPFVN